MSTSDWINSGIVICNVAIAAFTFLAARAARESTKLARQAADDSRQQAEKMNEVMLNTAKANALATRIEYYNPTVEFGRTHGWSPESTTARDQQEHLVCQLDRILDKMEVGPGHPCGGSKHNDKVAAWKKSC